MSSAGAPSPRDPNDQYVWTGSKLVVWGGSPERRHAAPLHTGDGRLRVRPGKRQLDVHRHDRGPGRQLRRRRLDRQEGARPGQARRHQHRRPSRVRGWPVRSRHEHLVGDGVAWPGAGGERRRPGAVKIGGADRVGGGPDGGVRDAGSRPTATAGGVFALLYDPDANSWAIADVPSMPDVRHQVIVVEDRILLAAPGPTVNGHDSTALTFFQPGDGRMDATAVDRPPCAACGGRIGAPRSSLGWPGHLPGPRRRQSVPRRRRAVRSWYARRVFNWAMGSRWDSDSRDGCARAREFLCGRGESNSRNRKITRT